jgi:hypothetical protein
MSQLNPDIAYWRYSDVKNFLDALLEDYLLHLITEDYFRQQISSIQANHPDNYRRYVKLCRLPKKTYF